MPVNHAHGQRDVEGIVVIDANRSLRVVNGGNPLTLDNYLDDGAGEGKTALSASSVTYTGETPTITLTYAGTISTGAEIVATAHNAANDASEFSSRVTAPQGMSCLALELPSDGH